MRHLVKIMEHRKLITKSASVVSKIGHRIGKEKIIRTF